MVLLVLLAAGSFTFHTIELSKLTLYLEEISSDYSVTFLNPPLESSYELEARGLKQTILPHGTFFFAPHSHEVTISDNSIYEYSW